MNYINKFLTLLFVLIAFCAIAQEDFTSNFQIVQTNQTVYLIPDNHLTITSGYQWAISPMTGVSFVNGTSATSTYPQLQFSNAGNYDISLTHNGITNLKCDYLKVGLQNDIHNMKSEGIWLGAPIWDRPACWRTPNDYYIVENARKYDFFDCTEEFEELPIDHGAQTFTNSVVSNSNGQLLFYTFRNKHTYLGGPCDSETGCDEDNWGNVLNRHHQIMKNGDGLLWSAYGTKTILSLPMPGLNNREIYYIISISHDQKCPSDPTPVTRKVRRAYFSIVDMSAENGLGEVVTKNVQFDTDVTNCVAAVPNKTNTGYWIVLHHDDLNQYRVYELTSSGFNTSPVHTITIGTQLATPPPSSLPLWQSLNYFGDFKFSPDRTKLAFATDYDNYNTNKTERYIEVMDFNTATGLLSNNQTMSFPIVGMGTERLGAIEYSPNSRYLYAADPAYDEMFVIDLGISSLSYNTVFVTPPVLNNGISAGIVTMELAPSGEIWIEGAEENYLGAIDNPNAGTGININTSAKLYITNPSNTSSSNDRTQFGIQNNGTIVRDLFYQESLLSVNPGDRTRYICPNNPITVSVNPTTSLTNKQWYSLTLGPISGATGNTLSNIALPGTYYFEGTDAAQNKIRAFFYVYDLDCYDPNIEETYYVCPNEDLTVTTSFKECVTLTHTWYDKSSNAIILQGPSENTFAVTLGPGEYYLEVETVGGCILRYDFDIIEENEPQLDPYYCIAAGETIELDPWIPGSQHAFASYQWYEIVGGTEILIPGETFRTYLASSPGEYLVKVETLNIQCELEAVTDVIQLNINSTDIYECEYPLTIDPDQYLTYSGDYGDLVYSWILPDGTSSSTKNQTADVESLTSATYTLTVTDGYCTTSSTITITNNCEKCYTAEEYGRRKYSRSHYALDPELREMELVESIAKEDCNGGPPTYSEVNCVSYNLFKNDAENLFAISEVDREGNTVWFQKYYYDIEANTKPLRMFYQPSYLLVVSTMNNGFLISKVDLSGNIVWHRGYELIDCHNQQSVEITSATIETHQNYTDHIIVFGDLISNQSSNPFVTRCDFNGALIGTERIINGVYQTCTSCEYKSVDIDGSFFGQVRLLMKVKNPGSSKYNNMAYAILDRPGQYNPLTGMRTDYTDNADFTVTSIGSNDYYVLGYTNRFSTNTMDLFAMKIGPNSPITEVDRAYIYNRSFGIGNEEMYPYAMNNGHILALYESGSNPELDVFSVDQLLQLDGNAQIRVGEQSVLSDRKHIGDKGFDISALAYSDFTFGHHLDYNTLNLNKAATFSRIGEDGSGVCSNESSISSLEITDQFLTEWSGIQNHLNVEDYELFSEIQVSIHDIAITDTVFCCQNIPQSIDCDFNIDFIYIDPCNTDDLIIQSVISDINLAGATYEWYLDGTLLSTVQTPAFSSLPDGQHEICLKLTISVGQSQCIKDICKNFTIGAEIVNEVIQTCNSTTWYKLCCDDKVDHYVLEDQDPSDDEYHNYNYNSLADVGPGCDNWIHHGLIHGDYIFNLYDANGCLIKIINVSVVPEEPEIHELTYQLCEGDCIQIDAYDPNSPCSGPGNILDFTFNDGSATSNLFPYQTYQFCYPQTGVVELVKDIGNGCLCIVRYNLTSCDPQSLIRQTQTTTSSKPNLNDLNVNLYPNPGQKYVNLSVSGRTEKYRVVVRDELNRIVLTFEGNDEGRHVMNFSDQADGLYTVIIETPTTSISKRLMLIKD